MGNAVCVVVMCVYGVLAAAFTGGLVWAMVCELREYGRRNDIKKNFK